MRLFLSIFLEKEQLDYYREIRRGFNKQQRNIRFTELEKIQLTVRFIGSGVGEATRQKIVKNLKKLNGNYPKPTITIQKPVLGFKRQIKPRILFNPIEESYEVKELYNIIHKQIRGIGARDVINWKQKNANNFHITFGRLKDAAVNRSTINEVKGILKDINNNEFLPLPAPFVPKEFYLVEGIANKAKKPIYRKLERFEL